MERYTVGSIRRKAHPLPHNTHSNGQHTSGAMDESSKGEHTEEASFSYTLVLVSVAVLGMVSVANV